MNTSYPVKASGTCPEPAQVRNHDMAIIAHNHICHFTPAGDQQPYLSFNFMRYGGYLLDQLTRDNITFGYPSAAEVLKTFYLTGFETAGFALNSVYG